MTFTSPVRWNCRLKTSIACVIAMGFLSQVSTVVAGPFQDEDNDVEVQDLAIGGGGIVAIPGWGQGQDPPSKKYLQAVKKRDVILQLQMQVDELVEVCGIDDSQAKKLNIAAKAVAQKQMEKWTKSMDEFQMWDSMGADVDDDKNVRVDEIDLSKLDPDVLQWISMDFTGELSSGPTNEKIWKKALKSALNDEQREILTAHQEKRKQKQIESTVEFFVQMYGAQLFLNEEQEKSFADLVRKRLADQKAPSSIDEAYNTMMMAASIRQEDLAEFMTKKQVNRWRTLTGQYSNFGMFQADIELIEEVEEAQDDEEPSEGDDG